MKGNARRGALDPKAKKARRDEVEDVDDDEVKVVEKGRARSAATAKMSSSSSSSDEEEEGPTDKRRGARQGKMNDKKDPVKGRAKNPSARQGSWNACHWRRPSYLGQGAHQPEGRDQA